MDIIYYPDIFIIIDCISLKIASENYWLQKKKKLNF